MIPLSLDRVAQVVGGQIHGDSDVEVTGVAVIDSREAMPGDLFVAFRGEHVDGHDFAEVAAAAGAVAVLGSRPVGALPTVVVPDVQLALQELARVVLAQLREHLIVVAVTGSAGKTTVKDMLAWVLARSAETVATRGSFNNEIGLPLTVLRANQSTRFLVLEMGARGIGHLAELARIAPPDVSLVLNVGTAHLGEFGSRTNIGLAKGELVEALDTDGVAVLNQDDPEVASMAERCAGSVITFGRAQSADLQLSQVRLDDYGRARFQLSNRGVGQQVSLQLLGEHQALNAAAVAAAAGACGLEFRECVSALEQITTLSPWRMELREGADGLVVINDAYNANPESMQAALSTLGAIGKRTGRRTIAVLGEMRELGAGSSRLHQQVGSGTQDIDVVLTVGPGASGIALGRNALAGDRSHTVKVESPDGATEWLRQNVRSNDVVLVKASRSIGLEAVAQALLEQHPGRHGGQIV